MRHKHRHSKPSSKVTYNFLSSHNTLPAKNISLLTGAEKTRIEAVGLAYSQLMMQTLAQVEMRKALPKSSIVFEGTPADGRNAVVDGFKSAQGFKLAAEK